MSAQPLNNDIQITRALRSFRQILRHESVAAIIKRLRPLVMSIPGDEILVEVKSRDTAVADFSPYMGQARFDNGVPGSRRGFPIVIGLKEQVSFANAQTNLPNVDFAFQIGGEMFLKNVNTAAGLAADLHQDARDLTPDL